MSIFLYTKIVFVYKIGPVGIFFDINQEEGNILKRNILTFFNCSAIIFIMNKEKYLTVGWNNILSLLLTVPGVIYIYIASSTNMWQEMSGLIGLAVFGVFY